MFKLFSTKKETPKYPEIVEQIHNEFFTAGDTILGEAKKLLEELEVKDLEKGKRLAAAGFSKTREAVVAVETENKLATTKEIADLVMYYQVNYPNNKFITEEQVKQICEKYGLVCGDTSMYKGFVPESKLALIEMFKLNKKDIPFMQLFGTRHQSAGFNDSVYDEPIGYLSQEDVIDDWAKKGNRFYMIVASEVSGKYIRKGIADQYVGNWGYVEAKPFVSKFKICAPLKDMEIPQGKELKGYKIQDIPDPVVLQPVKGGYLIICAWGDEASDEIVVNQINN